jgi:riboflavin kinase/FMN adenylyltransferase
MNIFWGKVKKHNKRGKSLGYPTANVLLHKKIPEGIYVSCLKLEDKIYPSVTFIGSAKTFNETKYLSETYILDFKKEIYGEWVSIRLLKKIRNNQKFDSVEELVAQMKKDEKITIAYFKYFPTERWDFFDT